MPSDFPFEPPPPPHLGRQGWTRLVIIASIAVVVGFAFYLGVD